MTYQKLTDLELTKELLDTKIVEYVKFNPELNQGFLKLNGVHIETPVITFPITLDNYTDEIKKSDIEFLRIELNKIENIESSDIIAILEILYSDSNKEKIIEAIKEYHRENLQQQEEEEQEYSKGDYDSVSATIRRHSGTAKPKGTITGISRVFKSIWKVKYVCNKCQKPVDIDIEPPAFSFSEIDFTCDKCNKIPENEPTIFYKNTVCIELQDTETFNDMDRLTVYLFDEYTDEIRVGEMVTITGTIQIKNSGKLLYTRLYGDSVQYLNRENIVLSNEDIEEIKEFASTNRKQLVDTLISMFDTSIVGYDYVKKGLLMSAVNTSDDITKKERINVLLIGDPALAKSKLAKRITKLVPNSRHESGQSSTGKSLTAIIEKTDDNAFLRPGPIPLAKGAICSINELGRQSMEDQGHLLDVMEEGEFTKNAFGKNVRIRSPTTIIATANPVNNSKWRDNDKVDLSEFPVLEPVRDRFDLKFIFKDRKEESEIRKFADELTEIEDQTDNGTLSDHKPFLIKYIQYAKKFQPKINEDAKIMLKEFYIEVSNKKFGSPRVLITLRKLAKAIARLKLKEVADEEDAREVMEFYNVMLLEFQKNVVVSQPPKEIAYNECLSLLEQTKNIGGITMEELVKHVCENNEQLAHYFGYNEERQSLKMRDNVKIRDLCEKLLNHPNIKRVGEKPTVLQFLCDPCDLCDPTLEEKNKKTIPESDKKNNFQSETGSHGSHRSHRTEEQQQPEEEPATEKKELRIKKFGYNWICDNCSWTGDRFFMEKHPCKDNIKDNFEKQAQRFQYDSERYR